VPYDQLSDGIGPLAREDPRTLGLVLVAGRPWRADGSATDLDGSAASAVPGGGTPLLYWGVPSGLACLDATVAQVWREGYGHHITRLMVLVNLATLPDVAPRELADWFWAAYVAAYDWVVEPNVLGMGRFAVGDVRTSKPYVAGAAHIHRMSDYCDACAFTPGTTCPMTPPCWAFLDRHRRALVQVGRLRVPLAALRHRAPARRRRDRAVFAHVRRGLGAGGALRPDTAGDARGGTRPGRASVEQHPRRCS
jgi:deoxyribodipyrimidine photolyase-related protein